MAKATQAQIKKKTDEWGKLTKQIDKLHVAYDNEVLGLAHATEMQHLADKQAAELAPVAAKHEPKIAKLQEKAELLHNEIIAWLNTQKKSVKLEGLTAIAEFFKGTKKGPRQANPEKFIAMAVKRNIEKFWKAVTITLKVAEPMLGKNDLDAICEKPDIDVEEATLKLKD